MIGWGRIRRGDVWRAAARVGSGWGVLENGKEEWPTIKNEFNLSRSFLPPKCKHVKTSGLFVDDLLMEFGETNKLMSIYNTCIITQSMWKLLHNMVLLKWTRTLHLQRGTAVISQYTLSNYVIFNPYIKGCTLKFDVPKSKSTRPLVLYSTTAEHEGRGGAAFPARDAMMYRCWCTRHIHHAGGLIWCTHTSVPQREAPCTSNIPWQTVVPLPSPC